MAAVVGRPAVELHLDMRLSEPEVRALEALAGYGADAFLRVFYERLGSSYLQPHEAGLRSLFCGIGELRTWMARTDHARKAFDARGSR